ncbi:hypothetical protein ACSVDA_14260 [Cytobacillus sp. Hm23]
MEKLISLIQKRKKLFWFITIFYIVFNGCFMFPINRGVINTEGSLDSFLFVVIIAYVAIAAFFVGLLRKKVLTVFLITFFLNVVGMGFRYILEYGEVSNTVNFITSNIFFSVLVIPLFVTLVYFVFTYESKLDKGRGVAASFLLSKS